MFIRYNWLNFIMNEKSNLSFHFSFYLVTIFLAILVASQGNLRSGDLLNFILILVSAGIGGFSGGLLAGLLTMLALRPNTPSISWKHMFPAIRIWGIGIVSSALGL